MLLVGTVCDIIFHSLFYVVVLIVIGYYYYFYIRKGWTVSFQYLCSLLLDIVKDNRFLPACQVSVLIFCNIFVYNVGLSSIGFDQQIF